MGLLNWFGRRRKKKIDEEKEKDIYEAIENLRQRLEENEVLIRG